MAFPDASRDSPSPLASGPDEASSARDGLARLYGEPLYDLPSDLYIPPDALEVFLEAFEGPLDLLLYLIRKQNFNVLDIPMAELTEQYLSYIDQIRVQNLELAGEYLLMAGLLIEIKSRLLLPARQTVAEEEDDPRAELVRRLLEYEKMKLAAQRLDSVPRVGRDFLVGQAFFEREVVHYLPEVCVDDLARAWLDIIRRAQLNAHHQIRHEPLSVREHMTWILRRLSGQRFMEFSSLFGERLKSGDTVAVLLVHFLAMLELARESLLIITQAEPYAPIYVRLSATATGD